MVIISPKLKKRKKKAYVDVIENIETETVEETYENAVDAYQLASNNYMDGKTKKALEILNEAIKKHPDHRALLTLRADVYAYIGEYQKAIEDWDRMIELVPEGRDHILVLKSELYINDKQYKEALEGLNEVLSKPQNPTIRLDALSLKAIALYNLHFQEAGEEFADKELLKEEIETLEELRLVAKLDIIFLQTLMSDYSILEDYKKAEEIAREVLKKDSKNDQALTLRLAYYSFTEKFKKAEEIEQEMKTYGINTEEIIMPDPEENQDEDPFYPYWKWKKNKDKKEKIES
jgi:tetratricopeptide (TPR) repeat protein|tara:strand:- start:679 stop:1548 length:870 start_codon:yes stop_codon:yes gene_type:complete